MKRRCNFAIALVMVAMTSATTGPTVLGQTENPDKTPFDFPNQTIEAEKDQYVLCPPRKWIDDAIKDGADKTTMIWYTAKMQKKNSTYSDVKTLAGSDQQIPNSMIIPILKGQTAGKGDILLTWWQTGSGMQRAIVVGGTSTEPTVMYLDIDYENPMKAGQKEFPIKADTFHKLESDYQPGTAAMAREGQKWRHGVLVSVTDDKVMMRTFGGKVCVYSKADTFPIPIKVDVEPEQKVFIPLFGSMAEAVVKEVDQKIGRIHVEYKFGGQTKKKAIAMGDVALELPAN